MRRQTDSKTRFLFVGEISQVILCQSIINWKIGFGNCVTLIQLHFIHIITLLLQC